MQTEADSILHRRSVLLALSFAVLAILAPGRLRAQADDCGPSAAVKAALDQVPFPSPTQTDWDFHLQRLAVIEPIRKQNPDNVFVERDYLYMALPSEKDNVIEEFKARRDRNPGNAQFSYLYGLALEGRQSAEAIKLFQ